MITNVIKNILKQIAGWLTLALAIIALVGTLTIADAYAAGTCVFLENETTELVPPDTGHFNFESYSGWSSPDPKPNYAAKVCQADNPQEDLELHGWMWNTNLGWVSLSCDSNQENEGIYCGEYEHGVKVKLMPADPADAGKMYGWAWSMNAGWISFGCEAGDNDGEACGAVNYGANISLKVDTDLGSPVGDSYGWADSVGWFKFDNMFVEALRLVMYASADEVDYGVWTKVEKTADPDEQPNKNTGMVANGTNGYDVLLSLKDISGNEIDTSAAEITVTYDPVYIDTIKFDQIKTENDWIDTEGSIPDYSDNAINDGASDTPKNISDFTAGATTAGGTGNVSSAIITSLAPTDNFLDLNGTGIQGDYTYEEGVNRDDEEIYYKAAGEGPDAGEAIPPNVLEYQEAEVSVEFDPTPAAPLSGDEQTWTETITPVATGAYNMVFLPPFEFETFYRVDNPDDLANADNKFASVDSQRNLADYFLIGILDRSATMTGFSNLDVNLELKVDPTVTDVDYIWILDEEAEIDPDNAITTVNHGQAALTSLGSLIRTGLSTSFTPVAGNQLLAVAMPDSQSVLQENIAGATAYTTVSYNHSSGETIEYFDNSLPRKASDIYNPAAKIVGYVSDGTKIQQGTEISKLGNLNRDSLRQSILFNKDQLIGGLEDSIVDGNNAAVTFSSTGSLYDYKTVGSGRVFYFYNVDVEFTDDLSWLDLSKGPVTIIIDGGDAIFRENVALPDPKDPTQYMGLGVIVLEDSTDTVVASKGGRVYFDKDVTDFVGYIFADGPMFRTAPGVCYFTGAYPSGYLDKAGNPLTGLKEPNFVQAGYCDTAPGTKLDAKSTLKNQIYMRGAFSTLNCIGCAVASPPRRGDNLEIGPRTFINKNIAQLYDLNNFAYYNSNDPAAGTASTLINPAENVPVYIDYEAIPRNLLGFYAGG